MCNLDGEDLLKTAEAKRETAELEENLRSVSLFESPAGEFPLFPFFSNRSSRIQKWWKQRSLVQKFRGFLQSPYRTGRSYLQ